MSKLSPEFPVHYVHVDHLNTPQLLTDSNQAVAWHADYQPFGKTDITVENLTFNLRFPGQYYDEETGLNYNYFRSYNPATGRYTQSDPIGLRGGLNQFIYSLNEPALRTDYYGLASGPESNFGFGEGGGFGATFVIPVYRKLLAVQIGFGISQRKCCTDGEEFLETVATYDLGVGTGQSFRISGARSGNLEIVRVGKKRKCLASEGWEWSLSANLQIEHSVLSANADRATANFAAGEGKSLALGLGYYESPIHIVRTGNQCNCSAGE